MSSKSKASRKPETPETETPHPDHPVEDEKLALYWIVVDKTTLDRKILSGSFKRADVREKYPDAHFEVFRAIPDDEVKRRRQLFLAARRNKFNVAQADAFYKKKGWPYGAAEQK
jgi:hypothetical protein